MTKENYLSSQLEELFNELVDKYLEDCETRDEYEAVGNTHVKCASYYSDRDINECRQRAKEDIINTINDL